MRSKCKMFIMTLFVLLPAVCTTAAQAAIEDGWDTPAKPRGVVGEIDSAFVNMTNWILGFISTLAVLFIIYGGVQYMTSAGNDDQMQSGKRTLTYALLGLVVAGLAYAIVNVLVGTIIT